MSDNGKVRGTWLFYVARLLLWSFLRVFNGMRTRQPRPSLSLDEGFLVVANHTTFWDPIIVGCSVWERPCWFLARDTLFVGLWGKILRKVHAIPVQRGGLDREALQNVIDTLKSGRTVVMFPEGTRSASGEVGKFRNGFVKMAQDAGVRVLPVGVHGGFEVWSRHQTLPRLFRRIETVVGEPMWVPDGVSRQAFAEEVRRRVADLAGKPLPAGDDLTEKAAEPVESSCKANSPTE